MSEIVAAITAAGTVLVAIIAGYVTWRGKTIEATLTPYAALAERVIALESRVGKLEPERDLDRAYLASAAPWIATHTHHATYPPPVPPGGYRSRTA